MFLTMPEYCPIWTYSPALMGFRIRRVTPPTRFPRAPCMPRLMATPAEAKMVMMEVRGMPMTLAADRTMTTMRTSLIALRKKDCREGSSLEKVLLIRRNLISKWTTKRPTTRMMIPMSRLTPAEVKNVFSFSISMMFPPVRDAYTRIIPYTGGPVKCRL